MRKTIQSLPLAAALALCLNGPATAQKQQQQDTIQLQPQMPISPIDPKILEQQLLLPQESPAEQMDKLTGTNASGAILPVSIQSIKGDLGLSPDRLPKRPAARQSLLAGRQVPYSVYRFGRDGKIASSKSPWNGALILDDPALSGRLSNIKVGKDTVSMYRNRDGSLSRRLVDAGGNFFGTVTLTPGRSIGVIVDLNKDGLVDLAEVTDLDGNGPDLVIGGDIGRAMMENWLNKLDPLCSNPEDQQQDRQPQEGQNPLIDSSAASVNPCPSAGGSNAGASPGAPNTGGRQLGSPGWSSGGSPMDLLCAGRGGDGTPDMGMVAGDSWTEDVANWFVDLIENGTDGEKDGAGAQAARAIVVGPVAGVAIFVVFQAEGVAEIGNGNPFGVIGYTPPERSGGGGNGGGGGGGGGGGTSTQMPAVGPDGGMGNPEGSLDEMCKNRESSRSSYQDAMTGGENTRSPVKQNCDNPMASAGEGIDVNCSSAERDNQNEPNMLDVAQVLANAAGGCRSGDDSNPGANCDGGPMSTGRRGRVAYGMSDVIGIDMCPGMACDPSSPY